MNKVILVLIDGLGYDEATKRAGYLEHLCEQKRGAKYLVRGQLPALSRPMYESLMTGLPAHQHGITSNELVRRSTAQNLFSLTKAHGKVSAAAAYSWVAELYGIGRPFDPIDDCYHLTGCGDIGHGIFYSQDEYPDARVYADAEFLRRTYAPDFLLIHPMNVDLTGHQQGAASAQYAAAAAESLECVGHLLPQWRAAGYDVVVTADHGMDALGQHGGNEDMQRNVPLYILSDAVAGGVFSPEEADITTLHIAPLLCALLGLPRGQAMCDWGEIRGMDPS